ncbi:hypothetical protein BBJ29_008443 [Phytophthora kernoviae]|uniref:Uncharacterized protein n=1 Tax=Phytophthora kernoviae TaxID=325452 RepID=A0A3F2RVF4_9STRA|nr:hypothetical protein BBJ29_008443 [Phytophthora kernoviae]RLN65023.1 hypothetical protein BBP00_00003090 [Phytophthora kernoviae]
MYTGISVNPVVSLVLLVHFRGDDDADPVSESGSVDTSGGSDVALEQPLLKAVDWFLTEEEFTESRGGSPRSDLVTYSIGDSVTTFTVAKKFFDSVYDNLSTTVEGANLSFDVVFGGIVERGGDVKILT